jgi:hypothetical protein
MTMHIKVGGSWQQVTEPHIKVGGTWRAVQEGWVRVAGVWQQFFSSGPPPSASLPNTGAEGYVVIPFEGDAYANFTFGGDGSYSSAYQNTGSGGSGTWLLAGGTGDFDIRVTSLGGASPPGSTLTDPSTAGWVPNQTLFFEALQHGGTAGTWSWSWTIEIRNTHTAELLSSSTLSLTAGVS